MSEMSEVKRSLEQEAPEVPNKRPKVIKLPENYALVFFDIETTGLQITSAEIIQIAAKCGPQTFKRQILPSEPLEQVITDITGISVVEGVMYNRQNDVLETVSKYSAMESFIRFLASFSNDVILIAHNGHFFDGPIVMKVMREVGMLNEFQNVVFGFSDTFPLLRWKLPGRFAEGKNYKLPALVEEFLGIRDGLHDAMNDVQALEKLTSLNRIRASTKDFMKFYRSTENILIYLENAQ